MQTSERASKQVPNQPSEMGTGTQTEGEIITPSGSVAGAGTGRWPARLDFAWQPPIYMLPYLHTTSRKDKTGPEDRVDDDEMRLFPTHARYVQAGHPIPFPFPFPYTIAVHTYFIHASHVHTCMDVPAG